MFSYAVAFAVAAVLGLVWTEAAIRIAWWLGAIDHPDERRVHSKPTPRLGGIAIVGTLATSLIILRLVPSHPLSIAVFHDPHFLLVGGLASLLVFAAGVADDLWSLSPTRKLAVEAAAAIIFVAFAYPHEVFASWSTVGGAAFMFVWILAVTNAFNLIDGLDGLASGLGLIISFTLMQIAMYSLSIQPAVFLCILGGALAGFLRYNFHPSRIFLGDSGSLFIGFVLAIVSISASSRLSSALAVVVPVLCLGLPLIETAVTTARRLLRGLRVDLADPGSSRYSFVVTRPALFGADRDHIHHRLLDLGLSHRGAVLILYSACVVFAFGAFVLVAKKAPNDALWVALFGIAALLGVRRLNYGEIHLFKNGTLLPLFDIPLVNRRLLHVVVDVAFAVASYWLATWIAFGGATTPEVRIWFWKTLPVVAFAQLVGLTGGGLYRGAYRCTGLSDVLTLCSALTMASAATWIALFAANDFQPPQLAPVVIDLYILATLVVTSRLGFRVLEFIFEREGRQGKRVLILGAGNIGLFALREIRRDFANGLRPIGFVDPDTKKQLRSFDGLPVFAIEMLDEMIERRGFDELVVADNRLPAERLTKLAERCELAGIPVRRFSVAWDRLSPTDASTLSAARPTEVKQLEVSDNAEANTV